MNIIAIISRIIGNPQKAVGVQNTIINLCGWVEYCAEGFIGLPDPVLICNTIKDLASIFQA